MKIDFVRHGQSESNGKGLFAGGLDAPLTELGIKQAEELAQSLTENYSTIFSSDLIRCRQTAEIINRKFNLPVIYDARLRERNHGSLAGKRIKDVPEGEAINEQDIKDQIYDYRIYGGESFEAVKNRVFDCIADIKDRGGKPLVITSGGIIRLLHHLTKGKLPEKVHNASLHEFEF